MASWRDSAAQQAQDDLDGMLNAALPFAQQMLAKNGEFFPFGASLPADGEAKMEVSHPGGERPESNAVLDLLVSGLRDKRDALRAVAIVADVRIQGGADAIRIELEHRDGGTSALQRDVRRNRRVRRSVACTGPTDRLDLAARQAPVPGGSWPESDQRKDERWSGLSPLGVFPASDRNTEFGCPAWVRSRGRVVNST
jgi:hypothetical protein